MIDLRKLSEAQKVFFDGQSRLLQDIEMKIAEKETEILLQVVAIREKAAIFKMTELERAREEKQR